MTQGYTFSIDDNHGHVPVLRERMAALIAPGIKAAGENAVILDGTLGAGGHTQWFLNVFPTARVIGLDRDTTSLAAASQRLASFGDRFLAVHCRFDEFLEPLEQAAQQGNHIAQHVFEYGFAGSLFDLGVSSMQLDQVERGFAYKVDAPLDMRMDPTLGLTAADVLNTYSHGDLARILKVYGDERFAGKIASAVLHEREIKPFDTSARLVELLYKTIPAATRRTGGHPAKRTFQALRIEVNRELEAIENVIPQVCELLSPGARAVFMSYQSLEDRIVKRWFKELSTSKTPPGLPVDLPEFAAKYTLVTKGAEKASEKEISENPRSASVRVRAIEAIDGYQPHEK
ncbi:S-adenosyl-methyltransferase MraW [Corynebacterium kutscheri]|uniref:Ribosomal RNA small subunit methyltransferase H n=1 Tax=Corynebacterium kutscheri TaxID=35755 RepID=A0A0F6R2C7_9CORY|nr:16S rRNA (cytosine(1402)-N(4))-methyltransferase RsmH [Corynebacterium kutscheri]AKE41568.1 16S rRNA (cytosine(1402)-N(4))-methyltransferase [Corynebacterium kutscheri]VEH08847.1 S-adenosyl-methyltransferase MraW [Corynebacterium kutscheri]VEH09892.1 S-adenosyl-methyltransferase MraW [Corynebacterium kutscheri]VEH79976.1 S-adenosyl-methyltransferase MraW [Corynebacterium kutscheri]